MPKTTTPISASRQGRRHNPLEADITASGPLKVRPEKRKSNFQDEGDQFVDSKASRKILRLGQELEDEDEELNKGVKNPAFDFEIRFLEDEEKEDGQEVEYEEWGDEDEEVEEVEVADMEAFNKFFPVEEDPLLKHGWSQKGEEEEEGPGTNLADLILEKIAAHEAAQAGNGRISHSAPGPVDEDFEIPEKVVEVYTKSVPVWRD